MKNTKRICIFLIMIALAAAGGCDRHMESRDPVRPTPVPTATPGSLQVVVNNQQIILSWQVASTSGIARFRIYRSENPNSGFVVVDSTQNQSVTMSGLPGDRLFYFQVASVSQNGIEGFRSETVSAQTGIFAISLNGGDRYANDRTVEVRLTSAGDASYVALSEQPSFADSVVKSFATLVDFELSEGDGTKTVYARFTFADGSRTGDVFSDDIILDTRAQIESVTFGSPDSLFVTGDTVTFLLDAGESEGQASISFAGRSDLPLFNDGTNGDASSTDDIFSGRFVVPQDFAVIDAEVVGKFTDAAGNTAQPITSHERLSVAGVLLPVELTLVEALSSFKIGIGWTRSTNSGFLNYRLFRSTTSTVTEQSTLVATITDARVISYIDTMLVDFTRYYYRVYVRDNLGRDTASGIMDAVTRVNQSPKPVVVAGSLEDGNTARLTWSVNGDDDFESYRIYRDNTDLVSPFDPLVGYISDRYTTTFSDYIPASWSSAFYRVYVFDRHGVEAGSEVVRVNK